MDLHNKRLGIKWNKIELNYRQSNRLGNSEHRDYVEAKIVTQLDMN